jgi:hypothetical protein
MAGRKPAVYCHHFARPKRWRQKDALLTDCYLKCKIFFLAYGELALRASNSTFAAKILHTDFAIGSKGVGDKTAFLQWPYGAAVSTP